MYSVLMIAFSVLYCNLFVGYVQGQMCAMAQMWRVESN